MAANVVQLTPPAKLTRHQRRALREFMGTLRDMDKVAGWGVVLWDRSGQKFAGSWHTGGVVPSRLIPEYCRSVLEEVRRATEAE